jgi:hypothetical protein
MLSVRDEADEPTGTGMIQVTSLLAVVKMLVREVRRATQARPDVTDVG